VNTKIQNNLHCILLHFIRFIQALGIELKALFEHKSEELVEESIAAFCLQMTLTLKFSI